MAISSMIFILMITVSSIQIRCATCKFPRSLAHSLFFEIIINQWQFAIDLWHDSTADGD